MNENITKDDLRQFRIALLNDISELLKINTTDTKQKIESLDWLRSRAIRRMMDISPATLQNLRVAGKIRYKKVLGSYYYKYADIQKLFQD